MSDTKLNQHNEQLRYQIKKKGAKGLAHNRVVEKQDAIYFDQGDGEIVTVNSESARITSKAPARFIQNQGKANIKPDFENGNLEVLKKYLPDNEYSIYLILVFLFKCMMTKTHYLALILVGPAGSGKSFLQKVLKTIIDPSPVMLRNQINKVEDLVLAALHCHLLDFNNVSTLSSSMQDALCTMLTGGCATSRTKYTNKEESVIHTHNPFIMNGIGNFINRDDLYERCLIIVLDKIYGSKKQVIPESELWSCFNRDLPIIMGGVFNALSDILRESKSFKSPTNLTRMADFHRLGLIVEKALGWPKGSFESAYFENISIAQDDVLTDSEVAQILIKMKHRGKCQFTGTFSDLKAILQRHGLPKNFSPKALSAELDRLSGSLLNLHQIKITKLSRSSAGSRVRITAVKSSD